MRLLLLKCILIKCLFISLMIVFPNLQGYITCAMGIDSIGFIMAAFGASSALGSLLCGPLLKYTGRQAIFVFGGICNIATLLAMALWTPTSNSPLILYIFATSLGITCTIWVSQLAGEFTTHRSFPYSIKISDFSLYIFQPLWVTCLPTNIQKGPLLRFCYTKCSVTAPGMDLALTYASISKFIS